MSQFRILCLGAGDGWHSEQLLNASEKLGYRMEFATYESLRTVMTMSTPTYQSDAGNLNDFDVLLTRTMPAGSLEQITFRLSVLHALVHSRTLPIVNPPSALEIAIDKFATLQRVPLAMCRSSYHLVDRISDCWWSAIPFAVFDAPTKRSSERT